MPLLHLHRHPHGRADMYGLAQQARLYDRHAGLLGRPIYRHITRDVVSAELPAGARVLDVGTGPGRLPRRIAAACPQVSVVGVDLSEAMIAFATAAAADVPGAERLRFQVADVTALPFDDGSVDLVVSSLSQHHWDNPAGGLRDIVRVLRPGGQAWIYDFRFALRDPETLTQGLAAEVSWERPAAGWSWFSPISRLVLRRP